VAQEQHPTGTGDPDADQDPEDLRGDAVLAATAGEKTDPHEDRHHQEDDAAGELQHVQLGYPIRVRGGGAVA
jgi:hypothetical protein